MGNSPVPVNSPHRGQWRGALMFSLIRVLINGWVNNREAGDLRRYHGHYDVIAMFLIDVDLRVFLIGEEEGLCSEETIYGNFVLIKIKCHWKQILCWTTIRTITAILSNLELSPTAGGQNDNLQWRKTLWQFSVNVKRPNPVSRWYQNVEVTPVIYIEQFLYW